MSIIEAVNLVSVWMMDEKKIKRIVQKCEEWLLEKHANVTTYNGIPTGVQTGKIMEEFASLSAKQCPLLLENMDCLIHNDRPLVCRAFGVFRDGVEICPRPLGKKETSLSRGIIDSKKVRPLVKEFFDDCKKRKPEWTIRTFVPVAIFRAASPKKFQEYIKDNKIASAKLIGQQFDTSLMWQPDLDNLRKGMKPEQIIYREAISGLAP
jgi:Fe-S-cluster containining protein